MFSLELSSLLYASNSYTRFVAVLFFIDSYENSMYPIYMRFGDAQSCIMVLAHIRLIAYRCIMVLARASFVALAYSCIMQLAWFIAPASRKTAISIQQGYQVKKEK